MLFHWDNFFVAETGAAAALTGLLFVAVSINIQKILSHQGLPERVAEVLILFSSLLLLGLLELIPSQATKTFGCEVVLLSAVPWVFALRFQLRDLFAKKVKGAWIYPRIVLGQIATLPMIFAGVLIALDSECAMKVLAGGVIATISVGVFNCWIFLVEINR